MKLTRPSLIPSTFNAECIGIRSGSSHFGINPSRDIPGAHLSEPEAEYKVVFDFVMIDDNLDNPYPMLPLVARYVNTLANMGVPKENGDFNRDAQRFWPDGLKNDEFRPVMMARTTQISN